MKKLILVLLLILFGTLVFAQNNVIEKKSTDDILGRFLNIAEKNGVAGILFVSLVIIYLIDIRTNIIKKLLRAMPTGDNPHVSIATFEKLEKSHQAFLDESEKRRDKTDIKFDEIIKKLGHQKTEIDNNSINVENLQNYIPKIDILLRDVNTLQTRCDLYHGKNNPDRGK